MNLVVDTNILFSAILSPKGKIHDLLLNSEKEFSFFAPVFLIEELDQHHSKILKISGYTEEDVKFLKRTLFHHIEFIDPEIVQQESWTKGFEMTSDVDEKDTPFVALAIDLEGSLWTGDKKLIKGLRSKGVELTLTTDELDQVRNK
jgi:predicted nucleic acid-binding protein